MSDKIREIAEGILERHIQKVKVSDGTYFEDLREFEDMLVARINAMLEMYNLDRPKDKKEFYDYAKSLGISVNDAQRLMNLADVNRPQVKVFCSQCNSDNIRYYQRSKLNECLDCSKEWEN